MTIKQKIIVATPMICMIIFLLLGYGFGLWHPGWLVFFMIPLMPVILGVKKIKHIYPFICGVIYVLLGAVFDLWHPGWIIFLTIPVVSIFTSSPHRPRITIIDSDDE